MISLSRLQQKGEHCMKNRESFLPKDWFEKGNLDLRRTEILLENDEPGGRRFLPSASRGKVFKGIFDRQRLEAQKDTRFGRLARSCSGL